MLLSPSLLSFHSPDQYKILLFGSVYVYIYRSVCTSLKFFVLQSRRPLPHPPPKEEEEEPREEVVIALYDFQGAENQDLTLRQGEEYVIIEKCDLNWYKARNKYG